MKSITNRSAALFCSAAMLTGMCSTTTIWAEETNLITNPDFENGIDGWSMYHHTDADAEIFAQDGTLAMTVWSLGALNYAVQLSGNAVDLVENACYQLEFDISNIPGAGELMRQQVNRLADSCVWTERVRLPETWEDVSILLVPVLADDGSVCGLCGVELSDLYFRLSYPSQESDFGDMVTVLAPVKDGSLLLSKGMIGGTKGTYLHDEEMLTVKSGKAFNTYIGERHTFLGIQTPTDIKTVNGSEMVMVTLIPQENYLRTNRDHQMVWICSSALFLIVMLLFSVFLSQKFVKPIARSIASIQTEQTLDDTPSGIAEIDALLEFVKSRSQNLEEHTLPPDIQELFDGFAVRAKQLTVTERNILKYYADGKEISEVAELACISIHTVRRHNANIYQKLEVGSREELMLYIELFARCGRLDELLQQ